MSFSPSFAAFQGGDLNFKFTAVEEDVEAGYSSVLNVLHYQSFDDEEEDRASFKFSAGTEVYIEYVLKLLNKFQDFENVAIFLNENVNLALNHAMYLNDIIRNRRVQLVMNTDQKFTQETFNRMVSQETRANLLEITLIDKLRASNLKKWVYDLFFLEQNNKLCLEETTLLPAKLITWTNCEVTLNIEANNAFLVLDCHYLNFSQEDDPTTFPILSSLLLRLRPHNKVKLPEMYLNTDHLNGLRQTSQITFVSILRRRILGITSPTQRRTFPRRVLNQTKYNLLRISEEALIR